MSRAVRSSKSLRLVLRDVVASTVNKCSELFWSKSPEEGEEPGAPEIVVGKGGKRSEGTRLFLIPIMISLDQHRITAG